MDRLDERIRQMPGPGDSLDTLECDVWARVKRSSDHNTQVRLNILAVVFALGVGMANAGLSVPTVGRQASEIAVFTQASMFPLSRLEAD